MPKLHRCTSSAKTLASIAFGALLFSSIASATVRLDAVDGASRPLNNSAAPGATPSPSSSNTIYGGTAGITLGGSNGLPYDTCALATPGAPLIACNNAAIDGNVIVTLYYYADKPGYPILIDNTSGTPVTIRPYVNPPSIAAGTRGSISFLWSSICTQMATTTSGGTVNSDCTPSSQGSTVSAQRVFQLGVHSTSSTETTSEDTAASITFVVSGISTLSDGQSLAGICEDSNPIGLCHWSLGNGDSKVVLKNMKKGQLSVPLQAKYVRLLWEEVASDTDPTVFTSITANSKHEDLEITVTDTNEVSVSPSRVKGLQNDKYYAFKAAVVDLAGNVGFYTSSITDSSIGITAGDDYCAYSDKATGCHFGHPGEVVGVLSKDLQCYIATAAYGSPLAAQVETFRQFRDRFLMPAKWGSAFIKFYYRHSPKYARLIADRDWLRALARLSLWPALAFAWLSLKLGIAAAIVASLAALYAFAVGLAFTIRNARKIHRRLMCQDAH